MGLLTIRNGNQLSALQRKIMKRNLRRAGWSQNMFNHWEHPRYRDRIEHRGFTLYAACLREGLISR